MEGRPHSTPEYVLIILVIALATLTCAAPIGVQRTPTPSPPPPTATPSPTRAPTLAPTPARPPVTLSPESKEMATATYSLIASVEFNAHLLQEVARQAASGALGPSEVPAAAETVAGLIRGMGIVMSWALIEPYFEPEWDEALGLYLDTAHLADRWANGEVDAEQVLQATGPIVDRLGPLVDRVEAILAEVYGVDVVPLEAQRRQSLEDIQRMPLGSVTPTP